MNDKVMAKFYKVYRLFAHILSFWMNGKGTQHLSLYSALRVTSGYSVWWQRSCDLPEVFLPIGVAPGYPSATWVFSCRSDNSVIFETAPKHLSSKRHMQLARFKPRALELVEAGSPGPTPPHRIPLTGRVWVPWLSAAVGGALLWSLVAPACSAPELSELPVCAGLTHVLLWCFLHVYL